MPCSRQAAPTSSIRLYSNTQKALKSVVDLIAPAGAKNCHFLKYLAASAVKQRRKLCSGAGLGRIRYFFRKSEKCKPGFSGFWTRTPFLDPAEEAYPFPQITNRYTRILYFRTGVRPDRLLHHAAVREPILRWSCIALKA